MTNREEHELRRISHPGRLLDWPVLPLSRAARLLGLSTGSMERVAIKERILAGLETGPLGVEFLLQQAGIDRLIEGRRGESSH